MLFCVFHPFLNSPENSEYFEYRHIGLNKKIPPAVCLKKNLRRLLRPQDPLTCTTILRSVQGGGVTPPWGRVLPESDPRAYMLLDCPWILRK